MSDLRGSRSRMLPIALIALAATSLVHHVHNAQFLDQYPNMPAWLSVGSVYAAWLVPRRWASPGAFARLRLLRARCARPLPDCAARRAFARDALDDRARSCGRRVLAWRGCNGP